MLTNMNNIKVQLDRFNCFHAYCHHYIEYYQKCCILDQNVVKRMKIILLFILVFHLHLISVKFIPILVAK